MPLMRWWQPKWYSGSPSHSLPALAAGRLWCIGIQKKKHLPPSMAEKQPPFAVTPRLFQDQTGKPLAFYDAVVGGRSVGTPGTIKLMWYTHQRHGKLPWRDLFAPPR